MTRRVKFVSSDQCADEGGSGPNLLGAEVDLVSSGGLSPYMRDEILASRSSLYEG